MEGRETISARLKREWAAAVAFFRTAPERGRLARVNARVHARAGADYVASWFSLWEGAVDLAVVMLAIVAFADAFSPRIDVPWKPLSFADPVGASTKAKLARASGAAAFSRPGAPADPAAAQQCQAFLTAEKIAFTAAPIASDNPACVVPDAIALGAQARLSPASSPMDCGLASAYLVWERQVAEPAARRFFAADVEHVNTVGVHQCRPIARTQKLSEHAQAKAMDVGSITLSNGTTVVVAKDWADPGPKGQFLHALRDGACKIFSGGALSPDYNADHHDHLHLDVGGYGVCG
ncbi:hypothetical protein BH09PSE2_BH09PSE2_16500 [soil metagenome]